MVRPQVFRTTYRGLPADPSMQFSEAISSTDWNWWSGCQAWLGHVHLT
jgi:hypothetical protein